MQPKLGWLARRGAAAFEMAAHGGAPLSPTLRQARMDTDANPVEDGREHLQQRQSQEADRGGRDLAYQDVLRT